MVLFYLCCQMYDCSDDHTSLDYGDTMAGKGTLRKLDVICHSVICFITNAFCIL